MSDTLPPVAKSFFTHCKKCDGDRYHTILAHTTATSAKMQCEVCGAKSTYKLPKAGAAKTPGAKRPVAGAALKRKEQAASARKNAHNDEYNNLIGNESAPTHSYNMKAKFAENVKINHPKFGLGYVKVAHLDKIEVIFPDEVRQLVHNRG